jgi:hypothetical protein
MRAVRFLIAIASLASVFAVARPSLAGEGVILSRILPRRAGSPSWNAPYYDPAWGMPVALVVPPTARFQTHWNWGASGTRITPIAPQFHAGAVPPTPYDRSLFQPAPGWPSSTDQMGDYFVRGPR